MSLVLASGKRELVLDPPWINAAGFLPPQSPTGSLGEPLRIGAWVTPATSLAPRSPAHGPRLLSFPGGFLLHTGHPNPGISNMLRRDRPAWRALGLPVVVHLLAGDARELSKLVERIESMEEVGAIELALGETPDPEVGAWLRAALTAQLPVIAQFPIGTPVGRARLAAEAGAAAVSAGPPRGTLPGPSGSLVTGRLYGPSLLPHGLHTVESWTAELRVPVLGSGGVTSAGAMEALFRTGAAGVILDTILWTEPERVLAA